jgi:hypothetical protein
MLLLVILVTICCRSTGAFAPLYVQQLQSHRLQRSSSFFIAAAAGRRTPTNSPSSSSSTTLCMAKKRKARQTSKADITRPISKMAIKDKPPVPEDDDQDDDQEDETEPSSSSSTAASSTGEQQQQQTKPMKTRDNRPDVSTMVVDEESGVEILQQGKNVMDVITRKAVVLLPRADLRLAQMFPGVPDEVRNRHRRANWQSVQEMIDAFEQAALVTMEDGITTRQLPPHPSVANNALDFVTANRDLMGRNMKMTMGRVYMRYLSLRNLEEAKRYYKICKTYLTIENVLSAPFRQMILEAEGRVGPNFGNLDIKSYGNGDLYERCANYLVLKGMVAHWEKKVVDADFVEKNPQTKDNFMTILNVGDPKRYLPDPPILYTLRECSQVCAMAQKMTKLFVDDPDLFADLPVEIRFLEKALSIKGATPVRQFVADDFCPAESITPAALREGLRRLAAQLENMQPDPYGDIYNIIIRLVDAMSVGTDDLSDAFYQDYRGNRDSVNGPGSFQTYTFNHAPLSRVRFLDGQYPSATSRGVDLPKRNVEDDGFFGLDLMGQRKDLRSEPVVDTTPYKVPIERAVGRPHMLGWLDLLNDDEDMKADTAKLGQVKPGRIIME